MHEVRETPFGVAVELAGTVDRAEVERLAETVLSAVEAADDTFAVYADHRGLERLSERAADAFVDLMADCEDRGLERSVVVFDSDVERVRHRRLSELAGVEGQRLVDASEPGWERDARSWIGDEQSVVGPRE
ncbi:MAG: hypothetical protein ABEH80_10855 [Halobaculum sp.]|jgi:anti-anti-sigma regulatory factor